MAIDLAFQASPDHPWVKEHPAWFRHLPDGSIRYAENPPKRYEDIYPLDFETADWQALWTELLGVVRFWIAQGVKVFRVDNPHTKPFAFWEWMIRLRQGRPPRGPLPLRGLHPPPVMQQLAKVGFTQSYTYFTWRNTEMGARDVPDRADPDRRGRLLPPELLAQHARHPDEALQTGGRAAFLARLVLAATLSSNYGVYGPAFELQEHVPRSHRLRGVPPLREVRDPLMGSGPPGQPLRVHRAGEQDPAGPSRAAVQRRACTSTASTTTRSSPTRRPGAPAHDADGTSGRDVIVTIVSLDHRRVQSGWVELDLEALGLDPGRPYVMHDLLTGARYQWEGTTTSSCSIPPGWRRTSSSVEQDGVAPSTAAPA